MRVVLEFTNSTNRLRCLTAQFPRNALGYLLTVVWSSAAFRDPYPHQDSLYVRVELPLQKLTADIGVTSLPRWPLPLHLPCAAFSHAGTVPWSRPRYV